MLTRRQLLQAALITGADLTFGSPLRAMERLSSGAFLTDVVILGATPGGLFAGIAAARLGCQVVVLERTDHIGGLPVNGLGMTDITTRGVAAGLFLEFVGKIKNYYINHYGPAANQVKDCSDGYHFEPHVAEAVFEAMVASEPNLIVLRNRQFDALPANVKIERVRLMGITVTNRATQKQESYRASVFVDGTYEGDLAAAAGAPFETRREGKLEYGEPFAGKVYRPYGAGAPFTGTTETGDDAIQAYNYRLCMTQNARKSVRIEKPAAYDRNDYAMFTTDVTAGTVPNFASTATAAAILPSLLPNEKYDINNNPLSMISTDLPEENWAYPRANWAWRDTFAKRLRSYTQGFLWFCQNDITLPSAFRSAAQTWGFAADEYADNGYFPRQLYVREGRRITGDYMFSALDTIAPADLSLAYKIFEGKASIVTDVRPPIQPKSIAASHYPVDSHPVRKRERNRRYLDGMLNYSKLSRPFQVPFGVIVPKGIECLLAPVPCSATHLGFGSLRLEPCWMALGEAAGVAAYLSIISKLPPRQISVAKLQKLLLAQGAMLIYLNDVPLSHPYYAALQIAGCYGCFPGYSARPNDPIDRPTSLNWSKKAGRIPLLLSVPNITRGQYAAMLFM